MNINKILLLTPCLAFIFDASIGIKKAKCSEYMGRFSRKKSRELRIFKSILPISDIPNTYSISSAVHRYSNVNIRDIKNILLAIEIFNKWKSGKKVESKMALYVERKKILESDDFNLSGDRYREVKDLTNTKWSLVKLGDICEIFCNSGKFGITGNF